jgi:hypothetical protein
VIGSPSVIPPEIDNVAPESTVVAPLVAPSALAFDTAKTPFDTDVDPL